MLAARGAYLDKHPLGGCCVTQDPSDKLLHIQKLDHALCFDLHICSSLHSIAAQGSGDGRVVASSSMLGQHTKHTAEAF